MKRNKKPKVVVVMPAWRAEKTLQRTFAEIPARFKKDIILVDDAGRDRTYEIAQRLGITSYQHKKNLGYGGNQKTCYKKALEAGADIVVMVHPDYQYDGSLVDIMIKPIEDGWLDIVLGNRIRTRQECRENGMPAYKYYSNRFLTILENVVLGQNLGEYHTGLRAYRREVLETLPFEKFSNDFVFDTQFLVSAVYSGFKIGDVPCPVRYFWEASSINFRRSVTYGIMTLVTLAKYALDKLKIKKLAIFRHSYVKH